MCGILGAINLSVKKNTLNLIKHRGPDDSGWFYHKQVSLGHVRLSIQDTSKLAHQPFLSKDGKMVLIFNGEIYNHWEIRKVLENNGIVFRSRSDTETILEGYLIYGNKIFEMLNGIFSICLYDLLNEKIVLVRDRFGVKPLYYSYNSKTFQFSSELKTINFDPLQLDHATISNYIKFLWSPGVGTPSKQIRKMLPGEICTVTQENGSIKKISEFINVSKFDGSRNHSSEAELVDKLDFLLNQAVRRQLLSDVPLGFFLSGGLDSSLLVAIARKLNPKDKIQCFTIDSTSFARSEGFSNDLDYAKKVAKQLNVDLEIVSSNVDIVNDFDRMIWHLDEPQADPAALNVFNISQRAASMGYKVLIGGTGGDDIFSGYRRHQLSIYEKNISKIPQFVLNLLGIFKNLFTPSTPNKRRLNKILSTFNKPKKDHLFAYFDWMEWDKVKRLFNKDLQSDLDSIDEYGYFRTIIEDIPDEPSFLNQMLHLEMNSFLVDHNFNYTDKMGMAAGIEIRVPFLDNDLVDFSLKLPPELKLNKSCTKYILKKVAERYLPNEVIYRSKTGFGAPVRKWITQDLFPLLEHRLSKDNIEKQKIFDYNQVWNLITNNKKGKIDASYSIWAILAIDSWYRQFCNKK